MIKRIAESCLFVLTLSLSACGGGSSDSGDTSATATGGTTTEGTTTSGADTTGTDTSGTDIGGIETAGQTASLAMAIQGSWMDECLNYRSLGVSDREINVITSTQLIQDFYVYDGDDCQGVPRGQTFPLRIYNYALGSDVTSDEGVEAVEMDLIVTQVSDVSYVRDGAVVGEKFYDIIGVDAVGNLRKSLFSIKKYCYQEDGITY